MTDLKRPVLVGIDGTASGLEALALAEAFAVVTGAPLLLGAIYGDEEGAFSDLIWPPKADAERWLDEASHRLGDLIPWSSETMRSNNPAHGLVEIAELEGARMIVLGSNRHGPLGRLLTGSTVRGVAHGAPCAVAVAPHDWRTRSPAEPLTFGAAVDGSPESYDAVALAATFAAAAGAPLKLFTAVHIVSSANPMYAATGTSYARWRKGQLDQGQAVLRAAITATHPQIAPEIEVLEGDPVECLERVSHDLDVLVVGSRRYGLLRRALLGSVSTPLLERAACPVVLVPRAVNSGRPEPYFAEDPRSSPPRNGGIRMARGRQGHTLGL